VHGISVCGMAHRATAVAARYLGLDCHLILRNSRALADADPGLTGNLLVARLAGAEIHQVGVLQDCILFSSLQGGIGCRRHLRW
jgi:1-aminocyclopropane-1-carboxylate deaminase/D-cysteine desulfhydrase-like pyridoxal-dependent ACC family enzyme